MEHYYALSIIFIAPWVIMGIAGMLMELWEQWKD